MPWAHRCHSAAILESMSIKRKEGTSAQLGGARGAPDPPPFYVCARLHAYIPPPRRRPTSETSSFVSPPSQLPPHRHVSSSRVRESTYAASAYGFLLLSPRKNGVFAETVRCSIRWAFCFDWWMIVMEKVGTRRIDLEAWWKLLKELSFM